MRRSLYALAAVVSLAATTPAQSAVVTKTFDNVSLSNGVAYSFDLDGDSANDFTFTYYSGSNQIKLAAAASTVNSVAYASSSSVLRQYSEGELVQADGKFNSPAVMDITEAGEIFNGLQIYKSGSYLGFVWAHLEELGASEIQLKSASYESTMGTPIAVVPEPTTGIFASLALAAGAFTLWRRRKSESSDLS